MNDGLKQFLSKETELLCAGVNVFKKFEGSRSISAYVEDCKTKEVKPYIPLFTEEGNDRDCKNNYLFMQRDIKNWLRVVLMLDMLNNRKDKASAVIYLPGKNIEVEVHTFAEIHIPDGIKPFECANYSWEGNYNSVASLCMDLPYFDNTAPDTLKTPIGVMDSFVLEAVLGVEPNPIIGVFEVLSGLNKQLHSFLSERGYSSNVVLTDELLAEYGIKDVLNVHVFDTKYPIIEKFLNISKG